MLHEPRPEVHYYEDEYGGMGMKMGMKMTGFLSALCLIKGRMPTGTADAWSKWRSNPSNRRQGDHHGNVCDGSDVREIVL